jgi:hypothetical protein
MASAYLDASLGVNVIGAREDFAGTPVSDLTAEEARFPFVALSEGALSPADAFIPAKSTGMNITLGSGAAKTDYFVIAGTDPGQGNYVVRLTAATFAVTIDAADPSLSRTDEVYLVVRDDPYDALTTGRADVYYMKGTPGAGAPGPDAGWSAYALVATVVVPAAAPDISTATLTDERAVSVSAVASTKLATGRTISLTGDVTGTSGAFDGTGNVSIAAVVADDSHTHDTRYYTETEIDSLLSAKSDDGHEHTYQRDIGVDQNHHTFATTLTTSEVTFANVGFIKPAHWGSYYIVVTGSATFRQGATTDTMMMKVYADVWGSDASEVPLQSGLTATGSASVSLVSSLSFLTVSLTAWATFVGDGVLLNSTVSYVAVRTS